MSDNEPTPRPMGAGTNAIVSRLLDGAERDRDRDAEEHAATVAALERQNRSLFRVVIALIVVLAILVSGIAGVTASGTIPGVGNILISSPSVTPPAPVVVAPATPVSAPE